jgi:hypothetical protein
METSRKKKIFLHLLTYDKEISKTLSKSNIYYVSHDAIFQKNDANDIANELDKYVIGLKKNLTKFLHKMTLTDDYNIYKTLYALILEKISDDSKHNDDNDNNIVKKMDTYPSVYFIGDKNRATQMKNILSKNIYFEINGNAQKYSKILNFLDENYTDEEQEYSNIIKILAHFDNNAKAKALDMIYSYQDIDEFLIDSKLLGYQFYSKREISRLKKINYKIISLNIVLCCVDKHEDIDLVSHKVKSFITDVNDINPVSNDFIISTIKVQVLYGESKYKIDLSKYKFNKNVTIEYIDIHDDDDDDEIEKFILYLKSINQNIYIPNLITVRYIYLLYKYQASIDYATYHTNIMILMNIDNINKTYNICNIGLTNMLNKIIMNKNEKIFIHNDDIAIGTRKIMLYYMLMYAYYGKYKPWDNVRNFITNGMVSSEEYYKIDKYYYLLPKVQLSEHILHFSDILMSDIDKIFFTSDPNDECNIQYIVPSKSAIIISNDINSIPIQFIQTLSIEGYDINLISFQNTSSLSDLNITSQLDIIIIWDIQYIGQIVETEVLKNITNNIFMFIRMTNTSKKIINDIKKYIDSLTKVFVMNDKINDTNIDLIHNKISIVEYKFDMINFNMKYGYDIYDESIIHKNKDYDIGFFIHYDDDISTKEYIKSIKTSLDICSSNNIKTILYHIEFNDLDINNIFKLASFLEMRNEEMTRIKINDDNVVKKLMSFIGRCNIIFINCYEDDILKKILDIAFYNRTLVIVLNERIDNVITIDSNRLIKQFKSIIEDVKTNKLHYRYKNTIVNNYNDAIENNWRELANDILTHI